MLNKISFGDWLATTPYGTTALGLFSRTMTMSLFTWLACAVVALPFPIPDLPRLLRWAVVAAIFWVGIYMIPWLAHRYTVHDPRLAGMRSDLRLVAPTGIAVVLGCISVLVLHSPVAGIAVAFAQTVYAVVLLTHFSRKQNPSFRKGHSIQAFQEKDPDA